MVDCGYSHVELCAMPETEFCYLLEQRHGYDQAIAKAQKEAEARAKKAGK